MVRETLDLYNKKTNIKKINKKMKKFPKLTERGRLHVMLRRCMQTETDNQTDHINMTLCILFYSNRCSTFPPPQDNRLVRRVTTPTQRSVACPHLWQRRSIEWNFPVPPVLLGIPGTHQILSIPQSKICRIQIW